MRASKIQEIRLREAQLPRGFAKVPVHQIGTKVVVTRFDWSVGGEYQAGRSQLTCLRQTETASCHQVQYVFQRKKRGMAFIHVVNRGLQANRLQCTVAA